MAEACIAPGKLENGERLNYDAPVVPDTQIPALLGMKALWRLRAVIDRRASQRRMYLGAATVIQPGDDTAELTLYPAVSGHLVLPATHHEKAAQQLSRRAASNRKSDTTRSNSNKAPPQQFQ